MILEEVTIAMRQPFMRFQEVIDSFESIKVAMEGPAYSCPQCRQEVRSRPVQVYGMKSIARKVASIQGESVPGAVTNARVWDILFPFRIPKGQAELQTGHVRMDDNMRLYVFSARPAPPRYALNVKA
ncbi:hypothetical protein EDD18DRAFT_1114652 [Armillaria luteobubalina]|uniref:Uncharacterized protein n=1 Tax=Armillaria luteobubalina TaxID=153913 RepID=A0AA39P5X6_9AGAR|nr:hypothetical protein EDD18DRAFT_1114652 [Armillaria luteobubalina]